MCLIRRLLWRQQPRFSLDLGPRQAFVHRMHTALHKPAVRS